MKPWSPRRNNDLTGEGEPDAPLLRPYDTLGPKAPMVPAPAGAISPSPNAALASPASSSLAVPPSSDLRPALSSELATAPRTALAPAPRGELAAALPGSGPVAPAKAFSERVESFQGKRPGSPLVENEGEPMPILRTGAMPDPAEGLLDPGRRALEKLLRENKTDDA
jgi:hypothetical protein